MAGRREFARFEGGRYLDDQSGCRFGMGDREWVVAEARPGQAVADTMTDQQAYIDSCHAYLSTDNPDHKARKANFKRLLRAFNADKAMDILPEHRGVLLRLMNPETPPWDGEGLPVAGTVCEWKEKSGHQWVKATVLFATEQSIVLQRADGFEWQIDPRRLAFQLFRTPEQIAAEERAAAVKDLFKIMTGHDDTGGWADTNYETLAGIIHDAGYRKQVTP